MDCHDALLMTVRKNGGSLHSRTTIQKLGYFYTQRIDGFAPKYVPYFYGPFSNELASALIDLSAFSFVNEIAYSGFYGGYTYELTESGKNFAKKVSKNNKDEYEKIGDVLTVCKEHCDLKPAPLSYAAKCHYILSRDGKTEHTRADIQRAGKDLRRDISDKDIDDGINLLQGLGLVN